MFQNLFKSGAAIVWAMFLVVVQKSDIQTSPEAALAAIVTFLTAAWLTTLYILYSKFDELKIGIYRAIAGITFLLFGFALWTFVGLYTGFHITSLLVPSTMALTFFLVFLLSAERFKS